jgi:vitamin B12 transport system substrate-binding protein
MVRLSISLLLLLLGSPMAQGEIHRVLTLSPHAADLVMVAAGSEPIVGISAHTKQNRLHHLPVVSDSTGIDREAVLALQADLAVVWFPGIRTVDYEWLKQQGIQVFVSHPQNIDDLPREIRQLGEILGVKTPAQTAAQALEAVIQNTRSQYQSAPVVTYLMPLWHKPPRVLGGGSFIASALSDCQAENVFADVQQQNFTPDPESLARVQPDIEIIASGGFVIDSLSGTARIIRPDMSALFQPGPRFIDAWSDLCVRIHEDQIPP